MTFKGADGAKKMQDMMDAYRKNTPKQVGAYKVLRLRDYKNDVKVTADQDITVFKIKRYFH